MKEGNLYLQRCPCHSGKLYSECCEPYHKGKVNPETPVKLMRSRYSAYALSLPDYLIQTTHPLNPSYTADLIGWKKGILQFSTSTLFEDLKIIDSKDGEEEGFVTFLATLKQDGKDVSFQEKSRFLKVDKRWLYCSGQITRK